MESFVRSKYESRRWALDGPPPSDPSVLESESTSAPLVQEPVQQPPAAPSSSRPTHVTNNSLSSRRPASPIVQSPVTSRQPQPHQLLSAGHSNQFPRPSVAARSAAPQAPQPEQKAPDNDLFTLDFHAPPLTSSGNGMEPSAQPKDVKQDILSLFSAPPAAAPAPVSVPSAFGQFNTAPQQPSWSSSQPHAQPTSMMGSSGTGVWGASSGWNSAVAPPAQGNLWGNPTPLQQPTQQQPNMFGTADVWGSTVKGAPGSGNGDLFNTPFAGTPQKKDDVFGDLWGGFK